MALNSNNVAVGITGAIYLGGSAATRPTDAKTPLTTGWDDLGYTSDAGVTESRSLSSSDIAAWQNGDVVRKVVTSASMTIKAMLLETTKKTVGLYYGTTVGDDGLVKVVPSRTGSRHKMCVDVIDGDKFIRTYIPQGQVTEVGDQVYAGGTPIGYEVTITAYADESIIDEDGAIGCAEKWYSQLVVGKP
ncbi:MAG: hypothetical protein LBH11_03370 [Propionibacteriaceae bacterium]|jgi:hypothetical protein|nr:hypothetical protein [Propionibacteriaceae bacterium]